MKILKNNSLKIFLLSVGLLFFVSCTSKIKSSLTETDSTGRQAAQESGDRAQQLLHYWDSFDFNDQAAWQNPAVGEQKFVDFIHSFPLCSDQEVDQAIAAFLERAGVSQTSFDQALVIIDKYYDEANSPFRDDAYYAVFLKNILSNKSLTSNQKVIYTQRLHMVLKNQAGNAATDFAYQTLDGSIRRLYQTKGNFHLLMFYDPTCTHCQDFIKALRENVSVNALISSGMLTINAICPWGSEDLWRGYSREIPANWNNGFDADERLLKEQLYDLKGSPTLYLLDQKMTVLLKDGSEQQVVDFLHQLSDQP